MPPALLSTLYGSLAEALADTAGVTVPDWLARPGREWPLFEPAMRLSEATPSPLLAKAVNDLSDLPGASLHDSLATWKKLLIGNGHSPLAVYESMYRNGRLLGPVMFAVKTEYQAVGLEVEGPELPDHIAVELEFLSFLTEQEAKKGRSARRWGQVRRKFIKNHAAQWMPAVGQQLVSTNDPVWRALGQLLESVITLPETTPSSRYREGLPVIHETNRCSLCGFCVQVCPVQALCIGENAEATTLFLLPDLCIQCRKCEQICGEKVLVLEKAGLSIEPIMLRQSPRVVCPGCNQATVSKAELSAVATRLGEYPKWLNYCMECRGRGF